MSATDWRNGSLWFLIHYGWRGTEQPLQLCLTHKHVSNPLRLEGDRRYRR